ncbi:MAG: response regulator, partial [Desulfobacterales bacterium]|nr:response regulator [Desulfobacterales bacterium]
MGDGGNKILFVDDDARFREAVTRCLRLGDDYECFIAKNGWDALEIMGREDIHLVISDIRMPGMTGLHLMSEIRTRHPEVDVILMTGFATDQLRNKIKRTDCLYLLEKPFSLKHLRQLIHDNIAKKSKGFNGTLKNIQLIDLLQMCTLSGVSIAINVTKDDLKGSILIKKGKIIHAEHKEQNGTNAFFEILSWENGNFETLTLPHEAPGTIDSQSMYLLMEAARRSDEKNKAARERERAGEKRTGEKADAPRTGIVRRVLVVE